MKSNKSNVFIHIAQIAAWIWVLVSPAVTSFATAGAGFTKMALLGGLRFNGPLCLLYFLNFYLLVPQFLFKDRKKWLFYVANILWVVVREGLGIYRMSRIPTPFEAPAINMMILRPVITGVFIQFLIILAAVALRNMVDTRKRQRELEEREKKATEAELSWLKNQLNPHFLFNTLNNISSLTQIDANKAQDSIAQLSDLLRYALYDSDKDTVQLSDDVAFMENYIGLMKLRCNDLASVTTSFDVPQGSVEVAPLLFISLIENAFKHGVNARKPSFVDISLGTEGSDLVFVCSNSLFEKQKEERIGSGIGLENMLRRLELIYGKDGFDYNVRTEGDMYRSEVRLKDIA